MPARPPSEGPHRSQCRSPVVPSGKWGRRSDGWRCGGCGAGQWRWCRWRSWSPSAPQGPRSPSALRSTPPPPSLQHLAADAAGLASFVGVDLRDGTESDVVASVQAQLEGLDLLGQPARLLAEPVRPPEIIDARATRSVPSIVGAVFATTAAVALAFVSWASVRARRRDLAVLRALGFTRGEVRRSVRIQSLATMVLALVLGVPAGLVAGRFVWRAFAGQLGVVSEPSTPLLALVAAVGGGFALALLAAQVPSRVAGGAHPADELRRE